MGRMQVLRLSLLFVLSWTGWASSATVDPRKTVGRWYHIFTASNELQELSDKNYLWLYKPTIISFHYDMLYILLRFKYSYRGNCDFMTYSMKRRFDRGYLTWEPTESSWVMLNSMDDGKVMPEDNEDLDQVNNNLLILRSFNRPSGGSSGNTYTVMALEPTETKWFMLHSKDDDKVLLENILDLVQVSYSLLLLCFLNRPLGSSSGDTYTVMALGREPTLNEADMEEFQKVLRDNGIEAEPMHFTSDDICIDDGKGDEYIHAISRK